MPMAYMFDVLTVAEAARALSCSEKTVRRAIADHRLVALDNELTGAAPLLLSQVVEQYRRDHAARPGDRA